MFKDFWKPRQTSEGRQKAEAGPKQEREVNTTDAAGEEQEYVTEQAGYERERFSKAMTFGYASLFAAIECAKGVGRKLGNDPKLDSGTLLGTLKGTIRDAGVLQKMFESGSDAYGTIKGQEQVADDFSFKRFNDDFKKKIDAAGDAEEKVRLEDELKRITEQRQEQLEEDQLVGNITRALLSKGVSLALGHAGKKGK
ncbi:MAG: hypothetical protein HGA16_01295 [Candidatus Moranbacteria bacterium]|nr:hypothetical protein [Candidatus Moranbacteria bacterium]